MPACPHTGLYPTQPSVESGPAALSQTQAAWSGILRIAERTPILDVLYGRHRSWTYDTEWSSDDFRIAASEPDLPAAR